MGVPRMKIVEKSSLGKMLSYDDLETGEVYQTTGGVGENVDGEYYIFTEEGSLVGLGNGDVYESSYGDNAPVNRWKYVKVFVELVVHE